MEKMILLGNGLQVMAKIIGELGVHTDTDVEDWYNVTHIKTGGLIASFSWDEDAKDFATKADALMSFDDYSTLIAEVGKKKATAQFKAAIHEVLTLRDSYTTYIPESSSRRAYMTRKYIKARVQS